MATLPDVDVLLKPLLSQPGVEGCLIYNELGERRSADSAESLQRAASAHRS